MIRPTSDQLSQHSSRIVTLLPSIARSLRLPPLLDRVKAGLTASQFQVLLLLDEAGGDGLRMHQLADSQGVSMATASESLQRLVDAGLAERAVDSNDRRVVLARLTADGRRVSRRLKGELERIVAGVLAEMTESEGQMFVRAVERVQELAERMRMSTSERSA